MQLTFRKLFEKCEIGLFLKEAHIRTGLRTCSASMLTSKIGIIVANSRPGFPTKIFRITRLVNCLMP